MRYIVLRLDTLGMSGSEEIFAKLVREEDDSVIVENARTLVIQQEPAGKISMALHGWMQGNRDGEITIYRRFIVGMAEMSDEAQGDFIAATTKLTIPR